MKSLLIWVLLICTSITICAQQVNDDFDPSTIADELARYGDDDLNYEELYENYIQLISNPIDINGATPDELRVLNILSESQISSLKEYLAVNGKLLTVYELQAIPGFDQNTIARILPLIKVKNENESVGKPLLKRILTKGNTYFVARYERTIESAQGFEAGESENKFLGSPDKMYVRFRTSRNQDYSFGFTGEKDNGERLQWDTHTDYYGTDYWSYHAQVKNKKRLENFILGDFQYQFGQGLILGNTFGLGKGGETINTVRKTNIGFSPYTSVNEGDYMRGVACTYALAKRLILSTFASKTKRDATVADSTGYFSSLLTTGLHRTESEFEKRHSIGELNLGGVVQYKSSRTDLGVIINSITFSESWQRTPSPYNQFAFRGHRNDNAGFFLNHSFYNVNVFLEAAHTISAGSALIAGMLGSLDPKIDMSLLFRRYERDYISFYTNAFAESTTPQNETGMYWGWKYKPNRKYTLSAYIDLFTFPWLKFRTYKPSTGNEVMVRAQYQPSKKVSLFVQARHERKERNVASDTFIYRTSPITKRNLLINCDYTVSEHVRMKTRVQWSDQQFDSLTTSGLAVMHDLIVRIHRLQLSTRFALFDTEDFDNRQYTYEHDAWLAYALPAYHGQGVRNYFMLQYKMTRSITWWLRYSRTKFSDRDQIGSGADAISSNSRNDIKLQVKISL